MPCLFKDILMLFQDKIEQYLKEIKELEKTFLEAQDMELLTFSFFSSSIDTLNRLRAGIYEIEAAQLKMMQEHLKKNEYDWNEADDTCEKMKPDESKQEKVKPAEREPAEENPIQIKPLDEKSSKENLARDKSEGKGRVEEKPAHTVNVLADSIGLKISTDFRKSLSLNDRFMFQRDLFQGNVNEMNMAFSQLNSFHSLNEVMDFLNEKYEIPWSSDSGIALKELLDKRFA